MYVLVKDLPSVVQTALTDVGYGRVDIRVETGSTVVLSSSGGSGLRSFAILIDLSANRAETHWGSWGGANMFNPTNAVDNDSRSYPLPDHGVAITGSRGGGRPVYAVLHIPTAMVARLLPQATVEVSEDEKNALYCYKSLKSGYRQRELERLNVPAGTVDALVTRGFLKRNRAGAVSITTEGKNAYGD